MKSIKVDEETYKYLLKLKYEHAMRGVKLTFGDLVKGLLLGVCHGTKIKKESDKVSEHCEEKMKAKETSHASFT